METDKLQLGIVVEDLERAIQRAEKLFGAGPFHRLSVPEAGVDAAVADWAGVELELIVAATDEVREQHLKLLKGKSARLTHVGAYVRDKDAALEHFRGVDVPVVYEDTGDADVRTGMVDLRNDAGFLLELLQRVS
ncbi:MAG: VOC family protein [Myxococcota bacterium]|nr:VOC family protein [Myxococcota bacterium]